LNQARAKSEVGQFRQLQNPQKLIGYHSNVPQATARLILIL